MGRDTCRRDRGEVGRETDRDGEGDGGETDGGEVGKDRRGETECKCVCWGERERARMGTG